MSTLKIELGSGNLKGSFGVGYVILDYTYDVPENAVHVSMHHKDKSSDILYIGNGKVTLRWDKATRKAHVQACVNASIGRTNEVKWTVHCWIKV